MDRMIAFLEQQCRRENPWRLLTDESPAQWRAGQDPHLHRNWELKIAAEEEGGEMLLIPPRLPHPSTDCRFSLELSATAVSCRFDGRMYHFRLSEAAARCNVVPDIAGVLRHLSGAAGKDGAEDACAASLKRALLENVLLLLRRIAAELPRLSGDNRSRIVGEWGAVENDLFEMGLEYIRRNYYRTGLGVGDIAHFVGVTPQYLNSLFRRRRRAGLRRSLIEIRLERARELLEERTYLVGDVARLTGWSSQFYFCNRFKKQYGFPPHELLK